ncbi:hypothetical protein ADP71_14130 [Vitreoscilla sp. C1]|uniref:hypothetical protein n=1 Tax=Vitreoscilla sp. (strain C1) TaxID=96942 RepID=UPI000CDC9174|nr:hypothetical protein [Vitreoscilla sp. C1]AUZ05021.1 hypothetical protein ADP71_14130 [Vitreoscilla sp. C1]
MTRDEYYAQFPEDWTDTDIMEYEFSGSTPDDFDDGHVSSGEEMFDLNLVDDFEFNF